MVANASHIDHCPIERQDHLLPFVHRAQSRWEQQVTREQGKALKFSIVFALLLVMVERLDKLCCATRTLLVRFDVVGVVEVKDL